MTDETGCDSSIFDVQRLNDIKKRPDILASIKLDIYPHMVMEPRFQSNPGDLDKLKEVTGYIFYIETQGTHPALMLMRTGKSDITSTVGMIEEIPAEMVQRAIDSPSHPPACGMYSITEEIKGWLKKELGL